MVGRPDRPKPDINLDLTDITPRQSHYQNLAYTNSAAFYALWLRR